MAHSRRANQKVEVANGGSCCPQPASLPSEYPANRIIQRYDFNERQEALQLLLVSPWSARSEHPVIQLGQ